MKSEDRNIDDFNSLMFITLVVPCLQKKNVDVCKNLRICGAA